MFEVFTNLRDRVSDIEVQFPNCVIVDIDGTLSDTTHRQHYLEGKKKDWPGFFAAMSADPPHDYVVQLVAHISENNSVILCTGRPSNYMTPTQDWLDANGVEFDYLMMRRSGDNTADAIVKLAMLEHIRKCGVQVRFSIDDRPEVVKMWRANGVPCFQVDDSLWHKLANQAAVGVLAKEDMDAVDWLRYQGTQANADPMFLICADELERRRK